MFNQLAKAAFVLVSDTNKVYSFMFNPSELTFTTGASYKDTSGGGAKEKETSSGQATESQFTGKVSSSLKMTLYFDTAHMVDDSAMSAFKAKVADPAMLMNIGGIITGEGGFMDKAGGVAGALLGPGDESKISVLKATDCGKIERLVLPEKKEDNHPPYVLFVWGTMRHAGYIEQIVSKYTMFSAQGTPLRAELSINMRLMVESQEDAEKLNPLEAAAGAATEKKRPSITGG